MTRIGLISCGLSALAVVGWGGGILAANADSAAAAEEEISPQEAPARPPLGESADLDEDGIPDIEEIDLGLDPADSKDGLADEDADGFDLAWELYLDADPEDPTDPPGTFADYLEMYLGQVVPGSANTSPEASPSPSPGAAAGEGTSIEKDSPAEMQAASASPAPASAPSAAASWSGVDSDADGLDDGWETNWFGGLGATASADPDGDGRANAAEQADLTDPTTRDGAPWKLSLQQWPGTATAVGADFATGLPLTAAGLAFHQVGGHAAADRPDGYSQRLRGTVSAPVTGWYTFALASDGDGVLWLGEDATAFRLRRVARVSFSTGFTSFASQASQRSIPVYLQGGQAYHLEAWSRDVSGADHLSLAWSYVAASGGSTSTKQINWAREAGASASQSSTAWGGVASRAMDGSPRGSYGAGGITHTAAGQAGTVWWEVNLGAERPIERVALFNRTDADLGQRLSNFRVSVLDTGGTSVASKEYPGVAQFSELWNLPQAITGSKIRVELLGVGATGEQILSLAEVEAWGPGTAGVPTSAPLQAIPPQFLTSYVPNAADQDDDYLPDAWEAEHGLNPQDNGATNPSEAAFADADGDGVSNRDEYRQATSPTQGMGTLGAFSVDTWTDVPGHSMQQLEAIPSFPDNPTSQSEVSDSLSFNSLPANSARRIRGFLVPPQDGTYQFRLVSTGSSQFWLTKGSAGATGHPSIFQRELLARVFQKTQAPESADSEVWTSPSLWLAGGQPRAFELLHKNGEGGGQLSLTYTFTPTPVNVASAANGATATQSATAWGGVASRAIDGSTLGLFAQGSVTHTPEAVTDSWLQVDLAQPQAIGQVVLFNRTDASLANRLSNFRLSLLDAQGTELTGENFFVGSGQAPAQLNWTPPVSVTAAKSIKIQLLGTNNAGNGALSLAEVRAFAPSQNHQGFAALPASHLAAFVPNSLDADGDTLPDVWETQYGLSTSSGHGPDGPSGDPDLDGVSNGNEFRFGTHPGQRSSIAGHFAVQLWDGLSAQARPIGDLLSNPNYLRPAQETHLIGSARMPSNYGTGYGQKLRALFKAPTTGAYTFLTNADDGTRLYLSTNASKFQKRSLLETASYTQSNSWNSSPQQRSAPVTLVAGQEYFLEILHKESGGPDHLAVGWIPPGATQPSLLPTQHIRSYPGDPNDLDDDYLPDDWETQFYLDPADNGSTNPVSGEYGDADKDTLKNHEEYLMGMNPSHFDSDDDEMPDVYEALSIRANPNDAIITDDDFLPHADFDGDGISNLQEYFQSMGIGQPGGMFDSRGAVVAITKLGIADNDNNDDRWQITWNGVPIVQGREPRYVGRTIYLHPGTISQLGINFAGSENDNGQGFRLFYEGHMMPGHEHLKPQIFTTSGNFAGEFYSFVMDYRARGGNNVTNLTVLDGDYDADGLLTTNELRNNTHPLKPDSDGDGLIDGWERYYGLNPNNSNSNADADADGLTNAQEYARWTSPTWWLPPINGQNRNGYLNPSQAATLYTSFANSLHPRNRDSDGDGLPDGWEVQNNLNPRTNDAAADPDGDGLTNLQEWEGDFDPNDADSNDNGIPDGEETTINPGTDTDGDGLPDLWELEHGFDRHDPADGATDSDQDGLSNFQEWQRGFDPHDSDTNDNGIPDGNEPVAPDKDSDRDGIPDHWETQYGLNPNYYYDAGSDLDNDGLTNLWEYQNQLNPTNAADATTDLDGDGINNLWESRLSYNPRNADSDGDGTNDGREDFDNDGLTNLREITPHGQAIPYTTLNSPLTQPQPVSTSSAGPELGTATKPDNYDSDGDFLPDGWEVENGLDPNSATGNNGKSTDSDNDGLNNFQEYLNGTNPNQADTDGDGTNDGQEVDRGGDPTNPGDNGEPPNPEDVIEVEFSVGDPSGSNSERWKMIVTSTDPAIDSRPPLIVENEGEFGKMTSKQLKLRRNAPYDITLNHIATSPEHQAANNGMSDYEWTAQVGGLPSTTILQPGNSNLHAVGGADAIWVVDNTSGLLGVVINGQHVTINPAPGLKARLLPVIFTDSEGTSLDDLKVATLFEPGVLDGTKDDADPLLDATPSQEKFFIEVLGLNSLGANTISINLETHCQDQNYADPPTELDMLGVDNKVVSAAQLLVSDEVDDVLQSGGIQDESRNDFSHKIQLGGEVVISSIIINGTKYQYSLTRPVKKLAEFWLAVKIVEDPNAIVKISVAEVEGYLTRAVERYAQAGVSLSWDIEKVPVPPEVNLANGLEDNLDGESGLLLDHFTTANINDIHVIYVPFMDDNLSGFAYLAGIEWAEENRKYGNNVFISFSDQEPFTLAHELGHVFTQYDHRPPDHRLMRGGGTSRRNVANGSKRLSRSEGETIREWISNGTGMLDQ